MTLIGLVNASYSLPEGYIKLTFLIFALWTLNQESFGAIFHTPLQLDGYPLYIHEQCFLFFGCFSCIPLKVKDLQRSG